MKLYNRMIPHNSVLPLVHPLKNDYYSCTKWKVTSMYIMICFAEINSIQFNSFERLFQNTSKVPNIFPSRCHRTIIRWLHAGIARASRSRVAFLRQSGSFLFPSYCLREAKYARWHRWSHEVKTKMTRFDKIPTRWPYEGQKWTHEFNTKMKLHKVFGQFFGMPKILPPLTKLLPEPEKLHGRSYDGLRYPHEWPDVYTIRAEFEHFL